MPKKLTKFGVEVRKRRVELEQTLGEMAEALGVSPSFLSGVEVGRKRAPDELVDRIISYLNLNDLDAKRLRRYAEETGSEIRIQLVGVSNEARTVAAEFARRFSSGDIDRLKDELGIDGGKEERRRGTRI